MRSFFRYLRAARAASRGRKLLRIGRKDEGRAVLVEALALLGVEQPNNSNVGVWFSERVTVLRDLSIVAAQAGDIEEATKLITEGSALWKRMALGPPSRFAGIQEWLAWGDAYLRKHGANEHR